MVHHNCKKIDSVDKFTGTTYIYKVYNQSSWWLCKYTILATTNNRSDIINSLIINEFKTIEMDYFFIDSVVNSEESVHFFTEFLNS